MAIPTSWRYQNLLKGRPRQRTDGHQGTAGGTLDIDGVAGAPCGTRSKIVSHFDAGAHPRDERPGGSIPHVPAGHYEETPMHLLATALLLGLATAQAPAAPATAPPKVEVPTIPARPEDVATVESIIRATYEAISGPAGPRQWGRDRSLYLPNAVIVATGVRRGNDGQIQPFSEVMDYQAYADRAAPAFLRDGFFEREIHHVTHRFGSIAHVLSTYETRKTADGPVVGRGVNSFQLYFDGTRWWIISLAWDSERPKNPIPAELLP
jgi:hypothetical protein